MGRNAALKIDDKVIGNHIRVARKRAKMTQSTCAMLLNISNSYYSRIECGAVHLNLDRLFEICIILKTRQEYTLENCCPQLDKEKYAKAEDSTAADFHIKTMLFVFSAQNPNEIQSDSVFIL